MSIVFDASEYYQWDVGRTVTCDHDEVHFSNPGDETAYVVEVSSGTATVPDELLQTGKAVLCYALEDDAVAEAARIRVHARARPEDYVYSATGLWTVSDVTAAIAEALEAAEADALAAMTESIEDAIADAETATAAALAASEWAAGSIYLGYDEDEYLTLYDLTED